MPVAAIGAAVSAVGTAVATFASTGIGSALLVGLATQALQPVARQVRL